VMIWLTSSAYDIAAEVRDADVAKLWWLTLTWRWNCVVRVMTHGRVTAPQMEDKVQRVWWRGWWVTGSSRSNSGSRIFILLTRKWLIVDLVSPNAWFSAENIDYSSSLFARKQSITTTTTTTSKNQLALVIEKPGYQVINPGDANATKWPIIMLSRMLNSIHYRPILTGLAVLWHANSVTGDTNELISRHYNKTGRNEPTSGLILGSIFTRSSDRNPRRYYSLNAVSTETATGKLPVHTET